MDRIPGFVEVPKMRKFEQNRSAVSTFQNQKNLKLQREKLGVVSVYFSALVGRTEVLWLQQVAPLPIARLCQDVQWMKAHPIGPLKISIPNLPM